MSGIQHLDQVMSALGHPEYKLKYFWTLCVAWDGAHSRRHALRVINSWRPVVVMFKEPFRAPPQAVLDRFSVTSPLVSSHPMEQLPGTFGHLVKDFSRPGDWVLLTPGRTAGTPPTAVIAGTAGPWVLLFLR